MPYGGKCTWCQVRFSDSTGFLLVLIVMCLKQSSFLALSGRNGGSAIERGGLNLVLMLFLIAPVSIREDIVVDLQESKGKNLEPLVRLAVLSSVKSQEQFLMFFPNQSE